MCSVPPTQREKRCRVGTLRRPGGGLHRWGLKAAFSRASLSTEVPSAHAVLGMGAVWFERDKLLSHGNGDINWLLSYIRMQALVYLLQRALVTWGGLLLALSEEVGPSEGDSEE